MAPLLTISDITNSDQQILIEIYKKDPFFLAARKAEATSDTFDFSYISGIVFMFSVMGLVIYANFHYDIKLFLIKTCIKVSRFRICCIMRWMFEFEKPKRRAAITSSRMNEEILGDFINRRMTNGDDDDDDDDVEDGHFTNKQITNAAAISDSKNYQIVKFSDYSSNNIVVI